VRACTAFKWLKVGISGELHAGGNDAWGFVEVGV
jgi:hypothetical protein